MSKDIVKQKLNQINKVREAYRKAYSNYVKEFNDLNKKFVILAQEVDNLFGVMEKVVEMQKNE